MSDRSIVVKLKADVGEFISSLGRGAQALGDVAKRGTEAAAGSGAAMQRMVQVAQNNEQAWGAVSTGLLATGAALAGVVGLAVREFASFDQAMSGVASTGEDARSSIDQLRQAAIDVGADTAYSATEAAQGIEELVRAGVSASDVLSGGLSGALDLAAAGQIGVAEAAGIASTAMVQFKLAGDQIPHLADLLAAGAGKAMGGVGDLGMALRQGGLVASQFGISIEETVGGLSAFAAAGLLGSDAGTSLKTMLLKLANPSKESATAMRELGINAYDAQGQFVGLQSLAGQLATAFADKTAAERDSAMATIFGSDAIRAANILYSEGAQGIADWTAAVDDAGYAATTAATLQDNLAGDLEKLGGAFSTLSINAAESANGGLRTVVQMLTAVVDVAGQYPAAAQAILGVVAAVGGLALVTGGVMKAVTAVSSFQVAVAQLSAASPGIARVSSALAGVGGPAALALAAVGALVAMIASDMVEYQSAVDGYADALKQAGEAGEEAARGLAAQALSGKGVADAMESIGLAASTATDAAMGDAQARQLIIDTYDKQIQKYRDLEDAALAEGTATGDYTAKADAAMASRDTMISLIDQEAEKRGRGAEQLAEEAALIGDSTDARNEAAAAAEKEIAAQEQAADAMSDALDAYTSLTDAIRALNDAQREGANAVMGEEEARAKWIETLQGASEQIKKNGTSLDENTAKGRANGAYLRDLATTARDATDAMLNNGNSVDVVNAKMAEQRASFIKTVGAFGVTGAAAEALADSYGLIPNYVETIISTPGAKVSQQQAADLNKQLLDLPAELRPKIITIANTQGAEAAQRAIDAVKGKTVTISVRMQGLSGAGYDRYREALNANSASGGHMRDVAAAYGLAGGGTLRYRQAPGLVHGPGAPTSDEVPVNLSRREFVTRASSVDYYGSGIMYAMNAAAIPRELFAQVGLAGGGAPGGAALAPVITTQGGRATTVTNHFGDLVFPSVRDAGDAQAFADEFRSIMTQIGA